MPSENVGIETTRAAGFARITALGVAALVAACSGETSLPAPRAPVDWASFSRPVMAASTPASPGAKTRAVAQAYADALASQAFAGLGPLADDDARASFPGLQDGHGRDAFVHVHDQLFGAFDQRRFVAWRVLRTGAAQAIEWTMSGVQARAWMGVAATQKTVAIQGVTLLTTKSEGAILDAHVYFDVAATQARLGSGPKELAGLEPVAAPIASDPVDAVADQRDNVPIVRASLDALDSSEAAYVAIFTDDVELHTLERTEPLRGKERAARAYFKSLHKSIGQIDTTTGATLSAGSFAVVEYTIGGEQIGPIGWVPRQGDPVVRMHVVDVTELRDGKIARVWRYDNPHELVAAGP